VVDYAVRLVAATRDHEQIARGASPRATLAVVSLSQAIAQMHGRDYVVPRDVQESFRMAIPHRLLLTPKAQSSGVTEEMALSQILSKVSLPKLS
jgi:MoxR-like ATPase